MGDSLKKGWIQIMKGQILIADDERDVVSFIQEYFDMEGYEVLAAYDGLQAIEQSKYRPDLIILDIAMPKMDGLEVCKAIRQSLDCPILLLTAKVTEADKLVGFAAGADDYVIKPFSIAELEARVEAHLRRENRKQNKSIRKLFGRLSIDYSEHKVLYDQNEIKLAKKEYEIIELLTLNAGQIYSRNRIYEKIWGYDAAGDDTAVTEHIKRIRFKIADYTDEIYLETVWGVGYRWKRNY
jgi:DNA-binding response OmpR family regulator